MASGSEYSSDDNFYGEDEDEEGVAEMDLKPCNNCGRNFNPDVLQRHHNICTKLKDRKAFDSKKQRLAELEKIPITTKGAAPTTGRQKKKNWRWQHEQFIKNIRAARVSRKPGDSPDPSPTINPDYVQCPHCKRRFNETAAERHIEFCKEQQSRIPKQIDSKYADKKEKQDKRSTYKPPLPGAKKRTSGPSAPVKLRTNSNSAPTSQRLKTKPSPPPSHNSVGQRNTKSDTTISGQRKKKIAEARNEERPISNVPNGNERYSKTNSRMSSGGSMSDNDSQKMRSGKGKGGSEPKWFEDLKRNDSGSQLRRNKINDDLDTVDSGMDLNENYPRTTLVTNNKNMNYESPVGIVRPSSRTNDDEFAVEKPGRTVSSGRRKMANFCHDCGTRYPVPDAKFCCECGVKRMALA